MELNAPPTFGYKIPKEVVDSIRAEEDGMREEVVRSLGWLLDVAVQDFPNGDLIVTIEGE